MLGSPGTTEQLTKLGSESSSISLEKLWRRVTVTVWSYLQQQETENRMRRERKAVGSCWTINGLVLPKSKVGKAERERSIWLEAVGRADGKEGLSVIYQTLTSWRTQVKGFSSRDDSQQLHKNPCLICWEGETWYSLRATRDFVLDQFSAKWQKWEILGLN